MYQKPNKKLRALILEVVDNQLRDRTPLETELTYKRLCREGYSDQEARQLIGAVVSSEIFEMMKSRQPYDEQRYVAALKRLPKMPWE
jgi:hypothetical protein